MGIEFDPTEQWDRVASELRAHKRTQEQAWGDIDNATLGRYLAGDLSDDERAHVDQALTQLPELRKLTDVVRDVLDEFDPAAPVPATDAPTILPFPQPKPRRKQLGRVLRQRRALIAAACLLLGLGLTLGGMQMFTPGPSGESRFAYHFTAYRPNPHNPVPLPNPPGDKRGQVVTTNQTPPLTEKDFVEGLGQLNKKFTVLMADTQEQVAAHHEQNGDYDQAETLLVKARELRCMAQGETHPETIKTSQHLARVYEVALNTLPVTEPPGVRAPALLPPPQPLVAAPHATLSLDKAIALRNRITRKQPGEVKKTIVPVLVQGFRTARTSEERQTFARAIGALGPTAADAVPDLVKGLEKPHSPMEREIIAWALGRMGPAARPGVPVLVDTLVCDCPHARRAANEALVQISPYARLDMIVQAKNKQQIPAETMARIQGPEGRSGVNDAAYFFSPYMLSETQRQIQQIARRHHVEVYTETVSNLNVKGARSVEDRARDAGTNGIYLLLCKEPPGAHVVVAEGLRKKGFTAECLAELKKVAEDGVKRGDYDRSLAQSVRYMAQRFERGVKGRAALAAGVGGIGASAVPSMFGD